MECAYGKECNLYANCMKYDYPLQVIRIKVAAFKLS